jgi:hypothetical protein
MTHRRTFIGGLSAGIAGFLVGRPSTASAETIAIAEGEEWLAKVKGKHRQVVDCTSHNDGFGLPFALNFIDTTKDALKLTDADLSSVVVYRHFSMPLMLNDAMWAKYHVGELLKVNDPKTSAPAKRNIFRDNVFGRPGLTYEQAIKTRPVTPVACSVALTVISGMAAPKAGVTADVAKAEWLKNLLPGVVAVPSGVYALNRAQQGGCTYCNGG